MQLNTLSFVALAVAAATSQMAVASAQSESEGFVEGSNLNLLNKNFVFYRDFRNDPDGQNYRNEWAHALLATFNSGYTQGTVGFGIDAHAALGLKLNSDRSNGSSGTGLLPSDSEGKAQDDFSYAGAAVKARISNTVLKVGDLIPTAPVFATGSGRLLTGTASGLQLLSTDIEGLSLDAGHFTSIRDGSRSTNRDGMVTLTYGGAVDAASVDYVGGTYALTEGLSTSLYGARLEDVWNQYYANLNYVIPLSDRQALTFDFNLYDTRDTGKQLAGNIDNTSWSLSGAYALGAHKLTLGYQQVDGDEPFDYISMDNGNLGDSIWLVNSVQYSDFNGPNEKSLQLRYDLDMAAYGVPGLTLMARYITGWDIEDRNYDGGANGAYGWYSASINGKEGEHWERDLEARYVVQDGAAKDLSFRLRYATHRANGFDSDLDEIRLITQYPLNIF